MAMRTLMMMMKLIVMTSLYVLKEIHCRKFTYSISDRYIIYQ